MASRKKRFNTGTRQGKFPVQCDQKPYDDSYVVGCVNQYCRRTWSLEKDEEKKETDRLLSAVLDL